MPSGKHSDLSRQPRGRPRKDLEDPSWSVRLRALEKALHAQRQAAGAGKPLRQAQKRGNSAALAFLRSQGVWVTLGAWRRWKSGFLSKQLPLFPVALPGDKQRILRVFGWLHPKPDDWPELLSLFRRVSEHIGFTRVVELLHYPEAGELDDWETTKDVIWQLRNTPSEIAGRYLSDLVVGYAGEHGRFQGERGLRKLVDLYRACPRVAPPEWRRGFREAMSRVCANLTVCEIDLEDRARKALTLGPQGAGILLELEHLRLRETDFS